MNELFLLVNHLIDGESISTVNARELHEFLEVKRDFSTWIKDRVNEHGFIEDYDYLIMFSPNSGKTSNGGRPKIDYFISLDMAKELSMVERNAKGKQARKYFIACEAKLKQSHTAIPQTMPEALRLAAEEIEKRQIAERQLAITAPKAEALELISKADGDMNITDASKTLKLAPKKLFDWLSQHKWIYKRGGKGEWIGYQDKIQSGYLSHSQHTHYSSRLGADQVTTRVRVTAKGLTKLAELLIEAEVA